MPVWKEIGEIGKSILRGTAVMVGTKRLASFADRAIPGATEKSRQVWEKVKSTKSTGKKDKSPFDEEDEPSETKENPNKEKSSTHDADFKDKAGE